MLLQEKMKITHFSPNEKIIVDFILEKQELIRDYSTISIANETYTSPSILIRIAKKLGFNGWNDLKHAFLEETSYLNSNFTDLDANFPFTSDDSLMSVANKIANLKSKSLMDTIQLLKPEILEQAVHLLDSSQNIKLFGLSDMIFLAQEFTFKMRHINKPTETFPIQNTMFQEAAMMNANDCAIFISYSGESDPLFDVVDILKHHRVPILAITSIGDNKLSRMADVTLNVTTREHSYSKIANFSSQESINLILDILYSELFKLQYDKNYQFKLQLSQLTEFRDIKNQIINDEN